MVKFVPPQTDLETISNKLNQILELKLYEMNKTLLNKKTAFVKSFSVHQEQGVDLFEPDMLMNVKKNFNLNFNEEENRVVVTSKFDVTEEEVNESVGSFEKQLEKKILTFIDQFSQLKFYVKGSLNAE